MYIIFLIFTTFALFGNESFESDEKFFNENFDSEYFSDDPYIGKENIPVYNLNKNGVEKAFYPNGILKYEISYRYGKKDGVSKLFFSDGKLNSEISFRDNQKDGMEKIFYNDGKLKSEINYRNNKKNGFEKLFYSNGRIRSEIEYRDGQQIRVIYRGY